MSSKPIYDLAVDPQVRAAAIERRLQRGLREKQRAVLRHAHGLDLVRVKACSAALAQRREELARLDQLPELPEAVPQGQGRWAPVAAAGVLGLCTVLAGAALPHAAVLAASAALLAVLADRCGQGAANASHSLQSAPRGWGWVAACLGMGALALGSAALGEARQRDADGLGQAVAAVVGASAVAGAAMSAWQWRALAQSRWGNRSRTLQIAQARQLLDAADANYRQHLTGDAPAIFAAAEGLGQAIAGPPTPPSRLPAAGPWAGGEPSWGPAAQEVD